jgi:hypothetical protein
MPRALGQGPVVQPPVLDWQTACQDGGDDHPERCLVCGRLLVRLGVLLPARILPQVTGFRRSRHEPPAIHGDKPRVVATYLAPDGRIRILFEDGTVQEVDV